MALCLVSVSGGKQEPLPAADWTCYSYSQCKSMSCHDKREKGDCTLNDCGHGQHPDLTVLEPVVKSLMSHLFTSKATSKHFNLAVEQCCSLIQAQCLGGEYESVK